MGDFSLLTAEVRLIARVASAAGGSCWGREGDGSWGKGGGGGGEGRGGGGGGRGGEAHVLSGMEGILNHHQFACNEARAGGIIDAHHTVIRVYAHTYIRACAYIGIRVCSHAHDATRMCTYAYVHRKNDAALHTYLLTHVCTSSHTFACVGWLRLRGLHHHTQIHKKDVADACIITPTYSRAQYLHSTNQHLSHTQTHTHAHSSARMCI